MSEEREELDAATAAWHRPLHHTPAGELHSDTAQTPGMQRFEALSARYGGTEKIWLGESHVGAQMNSADHHHAAAVSPVAADPRPRVDRANVEARAALDLRGRGRQHHLIQQAAAPGRGSEAAPHPLLLLTLSLH